MHTNGRRWREQSSALVLSRVLSRRRAYCGLLLDRAAETGLIWTDQLKLWSCGDFKEMTRFTQSLYFFPNLNRREVERGSACRVAKNEPRKEKYYTKPPSQQRKLALSPLQNSQKLRRPSPPPRSRQPPLPPKKRNKKTPTNIVNIYILLDVLLCSIAEYFYELCRILTSP